MKIGIVSSGNDTLALRKILTKYDHEYLVYHDQTHFPFGTKDFTYMIQEIKKAVSFLVSQWAETVILDPVYECALGRDAPRHPEATKETRPNDEVVLPLFRTYLQTHAFKYSLVGKIWILTDFSSADEIQNIITDLTNTYQPTEHQLSTKKFSFPFSYRVKSAHARPSGIADLGNHNPYLIRTIKNDLKYFKDANVDTILPMHYHYFRMQRTIKGFFNFHKTRFHDLSVVEECFVSLTTPLRKGGSDEVAGGSEQGTRQRTSPTPPLKGGKYSVQIRTNQNPKFLLKEKELVRLLQRGKEINIKIEKG